MVENGRWVLWAAQMLPGEAQVPRPEAFWVRGAWKGRFSAKVDPSNPYPGPSHSPCDLRAVVLGLPLPTET